MGNTNRPLERMSIAHTFSVGVDALAFSIIIGFIPGVLIGIGQSIHDSQEVISWILYFWLQFSYFVESLVCGQNLLQTQSA